MNISKMLTGHTLFQSFPPEQVESISRVSSSRELEKGAIIYDSDRKATHVFVLLEGEVHLRMPATQGETGMLVSRVGKGEFFGIAPLLGCDRYTTRAQCAGASKILYIEAQALATLLKANPLIGQQMMSVVARVYFDRYQRMIERIQKVITDLAVDE